MGEVRERRLKDGKKTYFIDYLVSGRRFRKIIGPRKDLAELALKDIEVKIARNELGFLDNDATLDQLFSDFRKFSQTNHTPSTTRRYTEVINNFTTFLKTERPHLTRLSQLNSALFEDYKGYRLNGQSENGNGHRSAKAHTVNFEIEVFRTVFNFGIERGLLNKNPTRGVRPLKERTPKLPRFLSEDESRSLLENCGEELYPVFFTFLNTGMRRDELRYLEWKDIDFERKVVKVRYKDDWHPKSDEREIPINAALYNLLKRMRDQTSGTGYVFRDNGKIWPTNKLRRKLMQVTRRCGLPDVTKLHTLRHTFAAHLAMKSVDLPTIQKLMGHADIQTTMIYVHLQKDHLAGAVDKLSF